MSRRLPRLIRAVSALSLISSESVMSLAVVFKLLIMFAFSLLHSTTAALIAAAALALYIERSSRKLAILSYLTSARRAILLRTNYFQFVVEINSKKPFSHLHCVQHSNVQAVCVEVSLVTSAAHYALEEFITQP